MSDSGNGREQPRRTIAAIRRSRWPAFIWGVPIAAVGLAGWLLLREISVGGIEVTVTFDDAAGMKANDTKVLYRGVEIGEVRELAVADDGSHVVARLDMEAGMEKHLNSGTRLYLKGADPSLSDPSSLKAMVTGPSIVLVPGSGEPARHFEGIAGPPPETFAVTVLYRVVFEGAVGELKIGAPVTLRGFTVGSVASVQLATDAQTGTITTPVTLMLDPTRFQIHGAPPGDGNWAELMNATLAKLVQQGLRARLTKALPLIGDQQVALELVPDAGRAALRMEGRYPEIPAASGGGLEDLPAAIGQLPVAEIGANVREITERLNELVSSPQLKDSIYHLDRALAELDRTVHEAGPQVAPTLESLRRTADSLRKTASEIEATAESARKTMGPRRAPNSTLQQTLHQLTEAARAIRSLADYLERKPESLIKGR